MPKVFVDHFKNVTQDYLNHRPTYPGECDFRSALPIELRLSRLLRA